MVSHSSSKGVDLPLRLLGMLSRVLMSYNNIIYMYSYYLGDVTGHAQLYFEILIPHVHSSLPERSEWGNTRSRANHDHGYTRVVRHVERMSLADKTWNRRTWLDTVQPCGTHSIMPGAHAVCVEGERSIIIIQF